MHGWSTVDTATVRGRDTLREERPGTGDGATVQVHTILGATDVRLGQSLNGAVGPGLQVLQIQLRDVVGQSHRAPGHWDAGMLPPDRPLLAGPMPYLLGTVGGERHKMILSDLPSLSPGQAFYR